MVEKWCQTLDEGGENGVVLTDLYKALDCIDQNLLLARLNAYGFEKQSINFIYSHLTKCKQRTKSTKRSVHGKYFFRIQHCFRFKTRL